MSLAFKSYIIVKNVKCLSTSINFKKGHILAFPAPICPSTLPLCKYEIDISLHYLKTAQSMILKLHGVLSWGPLEDLGFGRIYGTFFSTPPLVIVVPCSRKWRKRGLTDVLRRGTVRNFHKARLLARTNFEAVASIHYFGIVLLLLILNAEAVVGRSHTRRSSV